MAVSSQGETFYSDTDAARALQSDPGFVQGSSDPFTATAQTVRYMCELVMDSLGDGIVQRATFDARRFGRGGLAQFGGVPSPSDIWWWVKHAVKFVHHQKLLVEWLGAPDELQLLIRPDALLRMRKPKGDCAVFTTLVCAMLECAGYEWEIVTVAVDPRQPDIFSHVYARAILENGSRLVLDASHGLYPGWEVPRERISLIQVWDSAGNAIQNLDSGFRGLHGVDMRGMGQVDLADGTVLDSSSMTPIYESMDVGTGGSVIQCPDGGFTTGVCNPSPVSVGASTQQASLTPQQTGALSSFASQLTSIFGQVVAPTTQYRRNADGSISYVTPGSAPVPGSLTSTVGGSSSLLLLGGLALGAILLVTMMSKK